MRRTKGRPLFSLSAIGLGFVAIALPFLSNRIRNDVALAKVVWVLLVLRQTVSLLQVVVGPLPTVNGDPIAFNHAAMGTGYELFLRNSYASFLRGIYDALGGSHLLGCEISQLGFSIGIVAFVEIHYLLEVNASAARLVLLFGLPPSVLLNTSVVLREGLQVGFFLCLVCSLLWIRTGQLLQGLILCLLSGLSLTYLHNGFGGYLALVLPVSLLWAMRSRPWVMGLAVLIGSVSIIFTGPKVLDFFAQHSEVVDKALDGRGLEYIGSYQGKVSEGRSAFSTALDTSSTRGFLKTGPIVAVNYLFAPFPWNVRGVFDVYGLLESFLRLFLFGCFIRTLVKRRGHVGDALFLFGMFLSMELVWAAGTANWGTAFRHRVVAWGLLVILGNLGQEGERGAIPVAHQRMSVRERRRALRERRSGRG